MNRSIETILRPSSVAIIGASRDPSKRGARAISMLLEHGFDGQIVPINPRETEIMSLPCYKDVESVPFSIDLALVCTPARLAPEVMRQCGRKNIPGAVILAGGFSEASEEGAALEAETVAAARAGNVRIIGPNTAGLFDAYTGCNLMGVPGVAPGSIGVLSQSGNVLLSLVAQSQHQGGSGFSTFVGLGNEADLKFHDYLEFFAADDRTKALIIYLEGLKDGEAFLKAAGAMSAEKPIVLYKAGRTSAGQSAARSHSGSLAGDYAVALDAFRKAGVVVVERSDELFPVADILSRDGGRPARRVAVLSEGGGPISQAVDAMVENGLELPRLDVETEAGLQAITPAATQLSNPVDAGGGTDPHPRYFPLCSSQILADSNIDALLIVGYFGAYQVRWGEAVAEAEVEAAKAVVALKQKLGKPIVVQCHYADFVSEGIRILREGGIPVIRSIEIAARTLSALADYADSQARSREIAPSTVSEETRKAAREIIDRSRRAGREALPEPDAFEFLRLHGIQTPPLSVLRSREDVASLDSRLLDVPVALKVVSRDILHKTEAGGVLLNCRGTAGIEEGFDALMSRVGERRPDAIIDGVMVLPMASGSVEIILGITTDDQYGRILVCGLGGTAVEVYQDVAFCPLPLTKSDPLRLFNSLRGRSILDGVRGEAGVDIDALVRFVLAFSEMAELYPEISEIDLNPVILEENRYSIVDARMILASAD